MTVKTKSNNVKPSNTPAEPDQSISFTFSSVYSKCYDVFIYAIVRALPIQIRAEAVISYFGTNSSPSNLIDNPALARIAIEQVVVNKVISAKGSTATWPS
jgi:hypothetical protein